MPDIEKYGMLNEWQADGVKAQRRKGLLGDGVSTTGGHLLNIWWILQFYHNCVPLHVKLRIESVKIPL